MLVRIVNGVLKPKDKILLMASGATHLCEQTGVFTPKSQQRPHLSAGGWASSSPASSSSKTPRSATR